MIWTDVITTGLVSGMAGGLVVPAGRRLLLGDITQDWLQDELELDGIDPVDGITVRGKDGSLSRVWNLQGTSYDARIETEQQSLMLGRQSLLQELGKRNIAVRLFAIKRRREIAADATWPNTVLDEIGTAEARQYKSSYFIDWYLMATAQAMQPLLDAEEKIPAILSEYRPELLARSDDDQPCLLTGFLNGLVSGEYRRDLPAISRNLSANLPASDLHCDKVMGTITTHVPARQFQKVITVTLWPETVSGHLIGEILALQGDIEICQICDPWGSDQAMLVNKRRMAGESNSWFGNPAAAAEVSTLLDLLAEGKTALFATQFQIIPRAETEDKLNTLIREITEILGNKRIGYVVQTRGAPVCWFNRLPVVSKRKIRLPGSQFMAPLDLRDQNIAALWALPHSATGLLASQFGPAPVRWFKTPTGQSYAFQFQVVNKPFSLGNFLVFAPSGVGKSTLIMHLMGGLAKFENVRSYIFDSKEGTRFMVEAMGGLYQAYDGLSLNPLDVGDDTPKNRERVYAILKSLAGIDLEDADIDALNHAVDLAFQIEPPHRTLNAIYPFAFARRSTLRRAFAQWVADDKGNTGLRSHIFNAPHDSLGGLLNQSHMVGINMNEALADPALGAPVVGHISEAISKSVAGRNGGFVIFIDEAAKLLSNPGFRDLGAEMYREYRKLGGAVGMAFQDPAGLAKTGAAEAIIENTATMIFFPNSKVTEESLKPFNLNEEQKLFVQGRTRSRKKNDRRVLIIKRDEASGFEESAILDVDLTPLGDAVRFYRSGPDANNDLATIQTKWGDAWQSHL